MPTTHENIVGWINKSGIDYTTYFIKAWIPFNAWYDLHFHNQPNMDSDRAKINAIKNTSNPARNGINSYLENNDQQSIEFKNHLSALHHALQQNQLDCNDGRISFHEIVKQRKAENQINETFSGTRYFLERTDGRRLGEVTEMKVILTSGSGGAILNYQHTEYDLEHLQADRNYQNLTQTRRENTRIRFQRLEPIEVIDSIRDISDLQKGPLNYYECDAYNFKRDPNETSCCGHIICKAVIETLYQLRNQLFHGELIPNQAAQPIYQNAYFLLKMILEKIK